MGLALVVGFVVIEMSSVTESTHTVHQQLITAPHWLGTGQVRVPRNLRIASHAKKHVGQTLDAWRIYALLLEGKCVASKRYRNSSGGELYLCVDPVSGLVGGLFVTGKQATGWGAHAEKWSHLVRGSDAPFKLDWLFGR